MIIREIIDRLNDCAGSLEEHPTEEWRVKNTAAFLRATALRIQRDVELQGKIALVKLNHDLKCLLEDEKGDSVK